MSAIKKIFYLFLFFPLAVVADDDITLEETKRLQNPFEFARVVDVRQFGWFDFKDADIDDVNIYQLRYTHPVAESEALPEQFIRVTAVFRESPIFNQYGQQEGTRTGMGDVNVFDAFTLIRGENYKWGIGPSITLPTNQNHGRERYGNDNWRAGVAGVGRYNFTPTDQLILIFNWQKDVHGDDVPVNHLSFQPAYTHTFKDGWYFMSAGTWQFDLENDTHYIPVSLGMGKAFRCGKQLCHGFIEPQWVVDSDDTDKHGNFVPQPEFFVRINFTMMFPVH